MTEKQTCPGCSGKGEVIYNRSHEGLPNQLGKCDKCGGSGQLPEASDYGHHIDKGPGVTHFKGDDCEASAAKKVGKPTREQMEAVVKVIRDNDTPVASEAKPFKRPPSKEEQAEIDKYYPATPDEQPKLISNDPQLIKNEPKVISTFKPHVDVRNTTDSVEAKEAMPCKYCGNTGYHIWFGSGSCPGATPAQPLPSEPKYDKRLKAMYDQGRYDAEMDRLYPEPLPSSPSETDSELTKALKIFQDYTASWGYPMNQEAHERGLKIATERIEALLAQREATARLELLLEIIDTDPTATKNDEYYFNIGWRAAGILKALKGEK